MHCRVSIRCLPHIQDSLGEKVLRTLKKSSGADLRQVMLVRSYLIEGIEEEAVRRVLTSLYDPVFEEASLTPFRSDADWILEVGFRPGVTDTEGTTARDTLALVLGRERDFAVYSSLQYHLFGSLSREEVIALLEGCLANTLIQRFAIKDQAEWRQQPGIFSSCPKVTGTVDDSVEIIPFSCMSDEDLLAFSRENTLALSLEELHVIRDHYALPAVRTQRQSKGLPEDPTDGEVEVLAQTWSEHCKHKIFSSFIEYLNAETGCRDQINSLYKTCIQGSTRKIRQRLGAADHCRSVFKDNAGVVAFSADFDVCIKVETHNSPSALDPYGGAMTGVIGVNRDALGTGRGAEFLCNTDILCVASPFHEEPLPPRLLHPRRILEGARQGVEHGGNKSGVPTVNGSIVFEPRFLGKPLVFCGTVGLLPRTLHGRFGHEKKACAGDAIVMIGGRIGKDGIHGATFSSEELHEGSPATAVQLGDPITQRKLYDFTIKARDLGLYHSITDNGAGGLSSSVGEMAEDTGGCILDLAKAPLKYQGVKPWEILISEAQERMTLAVPQEKLAVFLLLAREMDVEAVSLGVFTDSGFFDVTFGTKQVAYLPMDFMHQGVPQMRLNAVWTRPLAYPLGSEELTADSGPTHLTDEIRGAGYDQAGLLCAMLGRLNICSKEEIIRQFDHEAKGGSVVKPLVGVLGDGPGDAAVLRPCLDSEAGIVLSHGICPKFSDADTYWMMANAIDEAVRNAVAVGADPAGLAGVDNFCWCDPVVSERNQDGEYKLAQLVRANKALEHFCLGFGVPCVSGKDSMKNDYIGGGEKISIPPTVLFSILGKMGDVSCAVTSDLKRPGDILYILGQTRKELAGSEIAAQLSLTGGQVPQVDLLTAKERYHRVHQAILHKLVSACHDLSDGGLAVALAEMCVGGRLGASVQLDLAPVVGNLSVAEVLYSESASRLLVTVSPESAGAFEQCFAGLMGYDIARIGVVENTGSLHIVHGTEEVLTVAVDVLADAFKRTLQSVCG